jgi:dolichyl-phosphate beta-glucosyltransferase
LLVFELWPIPLSIGSVEATSFVLGLFSPQIGLTFFVLGNAYRVVRLFSSLSFLVLFLPTYKLRVTDLFLKDFSGALEEISSPIEVAENPGQKGDVFLSIVIPAYNERFRLPVYLDRIIDYCAKKKPKSEIIIVDDGSTDGLADALADQIKSAKVQIDIHRVHVNKGKGNAVREGIKRATGVMTLVADADGATPIDACDVLMAEMTESTHIVIGSRKVGATDVSRKWLRDMLGSVFYRVTNLLAVPGIADTQCGFKLFRTDVSQFLFQRSHEDGWAYDVEILFLAQKFSFVIKEVGVPWKSIEGSKINVFTDGLKMVWALFRIRYRSAGISRWT